MPANDDLVRSALLKRKAGRKLTARETAALHRWEKADRETKFLAVAAAMPQKLYKTWAGRQTKQLDDTARRHGLPCNGATIDLPTLIRAVHDFLARNARRLGPVDEADPLLAGGNDSPQLERYRAAKADLAEMERDQRRRQLLTVDEAQLIFGKVADELLRAAKRLERKHGPGARKILDHAMERARTLFDRDYGDRS